MKKELLKVVMIALITAASSGPAVSSVYTYQPSPANLLVSLQNLYIPSAGSVSPASEYFQSAAPTLQSAYGWDQQGRLTGQEALAGVWDGQADGASENFDLLYHPGYQALTPGWSDHYFGGQFNTDGLNYRITASPVPEPGTLFLLGTGLFGLLGFAGRKNISRS